MLNHTRVIETFPSIRILRDDSGLPVEISLIAQLGHGSGDHLIRNTTARQKHHNTFIDELEEPSAKLGGTDFNKGDATSLYSFAVGVNGHPYHRHAGHRIFTAISGSGGAQLRFSTATDELIAKDPMQFVHALRYVNIPADCLFTVRFGGKTWHQFYPLSEDKRHPAFFAISCHTNEIGGDLPEPLKEKVLANEATIPSLTELLPPSILAVLESPEFAQIQVPTTTLSLDAAAGTFHRLVCDNVRSNAGIVRSTLTGLTKKPAYLSYATLPHKATATKAIPESSLLRKQLADKKIHHEDYFALKVESSNFEYVKASDFLLRILDGFLNDAPRGVSRLMNLRNSIVKPLGLRTSPLGCPVSTLLQENGTNLFANCYPVVDQFINIDDSEAQVILGTNDKHLMFRSSVGVRIISKREIEVSLANRVHCLNAFGALYMKAIEPVHFHYIGPTMLRRAVNYVLLEQSWPQQ